MFSRLSSGRIFGDSKSSTPKVNQADPNAANDEIVNVQGTFHEGATVPDCNTSEASGSLVVVRGVVPSAMREDDDDEVSIQLMGDDESQSVEGSNASSTPTVTAVSVSSADGAVTNSSVNMGNYFTKIRDIAMMAAKASPATGMMIAGHAQNVAKSVAVAAMSAVDTVEATKTAIMRGQEQRSKVRLLICCLHFCSVYYFYLSTPPSLVYLVAFCLSFSFFFFFSYWIVFFITFFLSVFFSLFIYLFIYFFLSRVLTAEQYRTIQSGKMVVTLSLYQCCCVTSSTHRPLFNSLATSLPPLPSLLFPISSYLYPPPLSLAPSSFSPSLPLPLSQVCSRCGSGDRTVTIMTSLASRLDHCQACGVVLCGTCSRKSFFPLPPGIRHSVGLFIYLYASPSVCLSVCISFCRSVRLFLPSSIRTFINS
jgi:hypothetical protein